MSPPLSPVSLLARPVTPAIVMRSDLMRRRGQGGSGAAGTRDWTTRANCVGRGGGKAESCGLWRVQRVRLAGGVGFRAQRPAQKAEQSQPVPLNGSPSPAASHHTDGQRSQTSGVGVIKRAAC